MRYVAIPLLVAFTLVFCLAIMPASADSTPQAVIEFPSDRTIDLGLFNGDSIQSGSIIFRNTGDAPLTITGVGSDCNCTSPSYTRTPIEPGDSGVINITYDGRDYPHGPFLKIIKVRSNASNSRVNLFVKGTIRRPERK